MDMTGSNKPVIISVGVGGWYPTGIDRLKNSLVHHGYAGDIILWKELPPYSPTHSENPYAFKIYAFLDAINKGYKTILWLDCSIWAIKNPHHIFDIIQDKGVFAFHSGYNCAQTCTDSLLSRMNVTRDEAEKIPEIATGMVGLNMDNPEASALFGLWSKLCLEGYFKNNRLHDVRDSADPRFLHGRQDQSAFSIAASSCNIQVSFNEYIAYYNTNYNKEKCVFFINGL